MTVPPSDPDAAPPDRTGGPGRLESTRERSGLEVVALTQGQLVRRRFLRHRGAMTASVVLLLIVLLAFTSIGFGPVPGWWGKTFLTTYTPVDGGRPTLDVFPAFIDGDGMRIGEHPFGQSSVGQDYFARTMRGAQRSILIALIIGVVSVAVGLTVGCLAGFYRGRIEAVLMRLTDVVITIPTLVIGAVVATSFGGSGLVPLGLVLGLVLWTSLARLVRGEILSLREKEYIEAARAIGTPGGRIIRRHILPNIVGTVIVNATLTIAVAILLESALSFLGFGIRAPDTSLGALISEYQSAFNTRPWLFWWPGLFIVAIALTINFIGDGLRDAFDPRQTRVRA